jgi:predicted aldo/keto reductase-like oxidoreductase
VLKRRLGRTNFEASVVGFGGIPIGRQPREEAVKVVRRAIELGVNFIDTARSYGESEAIIGEAIKGMRDGLFISTKSHFRTKTEVKNSIEESLRRLQINRLDLIFIHGVDSEEELEYRLKMGVLEAMKEAREAGKVNYIGISGHQPGVLVKAIRTGEFETVMAPYNLRYQEAGELLPLAQELDVGVIAMKPLGGGFLTVPAEAMQYGVTERAVCTAEAALRFVLSNPAVTTAIPGMANTAQVEENVPVGNVPAAMSLQEKRLLQERARSMIYTSCMQCGYCLIECPNEIDIKDVFRLRNFYEQFGLVDYTKRKYQEQYEDKVALCSECMACVGRCPAQLDIPAELREADAILGSKH